MDLQRIFVIVLDGVGAGEAPDAAEYGDQGSDSLGNTSRAVGGLHLPNMVEIGLGNLTAIQGVPPRSKTRGAYGRMQEASDERRYEPAGRHDPASARHERERPSVLHGPDEVAAERSAQLELVAHA